MYFPTQAMRRMATLVAALSVGVAVSSCGGGEPYTGLWEGTLDGNRVASAIVLGDGTYYLKYAGTPGTLGGLVRGTGDFQGARFTSTDGVDYHFAFPPRAPSRTAINGKVTGSNGLAGNMNGAPLQLNYLKEFDPDGKVADLAGSYPGEVTFSLGLRQTTFEVTADGKLSTVLNGCTITGQVTPRRDDAYDLTIQFGGAPCVFPGAAFSGAAVYSHDLQQLEAAVVNPAFGQAVTFVARKAS
jgi:hypothetical protein